MQIVTEGGDLRVWCITQKPQNKKRTWMNDLDEHKNAVYGYKINKK